MDAAYDAEIAALRAAASTATHMRELAQQRIVVAFRAEVQGMGPGPTDADLQSFARLTLVEESLHKHLGAVLMESTAKAGAWGT